MELKNKYIVGVHVMFYEIEMLPEYIDACLGMLTDISNPENITYHFTWNISEYFETIDTKSISGGIDTLNKKFTDQVDRLSSLGVGCLIDTKTNDDRVYNIADYRRDLNYNYCQDYDFVLWGETDSFWPRESFSIIEQIDEYALQNNIFKYTLFFSERKMWDNSWKPIEHIDFTDIPYQENMDWAINNLASSKSYMKLNQMYEINDKVEDLDIRILADPVFDGSCLVIKSDLIKAGVNIPQSLLCSGEDTSFGSMAKLLLGDEYRQFVIKNILRVHNRRHPKKRNYILNEDNPRGFCGVDQKGNWWKILSDHSKTNLANLKRQVKTFTMNDVFKAINDDNNANK